MKILLADDHALFRAGLCDILRQLDEGVEIIEAGTCTEMLSVVAAHPDLALALVDIRMPDGDGLAALMQSVDMLPVVVLSASEKREDMERALRGGALGFMPKSITPAVMISGLRLVLAGGRYVPPEMMNRAKTPNTDGEHDITSLDLNARERQVLARVVEGKTNKMIARDLGLAESTVVAHLTTLFRVLKVSNRTQAARVAGNLKLTSP